MSRHQVINWRSVLGLMAGLALLTGLLVADIDYKIGAKDLLEINVFQLTELNQTVRVSESGFISLPLLGKIKVEGLTSAELEGVIGKRLSEKYLQDPQVTVFIKEYRSRMVYVIGAVARPGSYEVVGTNSVLQVIAQAGGFNEFVAGDAMLIIRGTKVIPIRLEDLLETYNPEANVDVQASDLLIVPNARAKFIYVMGEVRAPGVISIRKAGQISLLEVIAQAGGFTDRASRSNVLLHRKVEGETKTFTFNVKDIISGKAKDFPVTENDIIYVKESIF